VDRRAAVVVDVAARRTQIGRGEDVRAADVSGTSEVGGGVRWELSL
jgi:hypothetical protein